MNKTNGYKTNTENENTKPTSGCQAAAAAATTGTLTVGATNASLYYEERGAGEVVLLIHAHSVDCRMWDEQFEALSNRYRVVRYDLRGYGRSDMPGADERYLHADDLIDLMNKLGLGKAHLVGLSLGSMVALDVYGKYPERVLSAVCAASGLYADERIWEDDVSGAMLARDPIEPVAFKRNWMKLMLRHSGSGKALIERPLHDMVDSWSLWQPQYERLRPLLGPPLLDMLKRVPDGLPLLVVIGECDSEGSRHSSLRLLERLPAAEKAVLPDAGHFSNMEQPQLFTQIVESFVARAGQRTQPTDAEQAEQTEQ